MPSFASPGKIVVATPGTLVPITVGAHPVHSIQIQPLLANAGSVYIGVGALVRSTLAGVMAVLPKPASSTSGPITPWIAANENAITGINPNELFIDADNGGDGVLVTEILA